MKTFKEIRNITEMSALSTVHVIHHPEKGYREKGGGYSKELSNKTKTFKSHDTAANSTNRLIQTYHHQDKKDGKVYTSVHTTVHPGERVHTINHATGKVTKGDHLETRQKNAVNKLVKWGNNRPSKDSVYKPGKNLRPGLDKGKSKSAQHPNTKSLELG